MRSRLNECAECSAELGQLHYAACSLNGSGNRVQEYETLGKQVEALRLALKEPLGEHGDRAPWDYSHLFEPPPGKIVVKNDDDETAKVGSLYVVRFGATTVGTVCAVYEEFDAPDGTGKVECFWRVGDRVIYGPNAGMEIGLDVDGARMKVRVVGEKEILTRIKDTSINSEQTSVI